MKNQLLKWGFESIGILGTQHYYQLESGRIHIAVCLVDNEISKVTLSIGQSIADVPNCNNKFMLFTFLYQLGLIEI